MKRFRSDRFLQWFCFLPVILAVAILYGALQGAISMVGRMLQQLSADCVAQADATA